MQKIEDGGPSKRPSASVRRLEFLKIKICTNNAGSRRPACVITSWEMSKGSRVGSATDSRQLAVDKVQKDGLYDVQKGGSTTGEVVCLSLPSIRSW